MYRPYDPRWLVEASKVYATDYPWLPSALANCVRAKQGKLYVHFIDSYRPNKEGSEWQFQENITLEEAENGVVVLDILKGNRVGGFEFYDRLFDNKKA